MIFNSAVPSGTIPSRPQSSYLDRDGALSSRPVTASPKQTIASFEPKRTSARRRIFTLVFFWKFLMIRCCWWRNGTNE